MVLAVLATARSEADVKLPAVFGDHMVVQCEAPIKVWGWADPGEAVTVAFNGKTHAATAGTDGRWRVTLTPVPAGGAYEMIVTGKTKVVIKDILSGEVWVCSGQSNMFWPVSGSGNGAQESAAAQWPKIRLFTVEQAVSDEPLADCKGRWQACAPESVRDFSAAAYYFGRDLHRQLGVPVGLIHSSWRGTDIESWTSREGLQPYPEVFKHAAGRRAIDIERYPLRMKRHATEMAAWTSAVATAKQAGTKPPSRPKPPADPATSPGTHRLYNAMIAPLVPYSMRGVLWYQGEKNVPNAHEYRTLFPAMIADWRRVWGQGAFPFVFAQIGSWAREAPAAPGDNAYAELREAQSMTLAVTNTAMAVMLDIGEGKVHFPNKQEAGRRLALAALARVYGRTNLVYSGPVYASRTVDGEKVRLSFQHTGGGLVLKTAPTWTSFAVAGEDRKFVWAEAAVEKDELVVRSPAVSRPVAVRYAWDERVPMVLYNVEGLPASPFRTDEWPCSTAPKH
jgi:sialate O-acetylesterase